MPACVHAEIQIGVCPESRLPVHGLSKGPTPRPTVRKLTHATPTQDLEKQCGLQQGGSFVPCISWGQPDTLGVLATPSIYLLGLGAQAASSAGAGAAG